MARIITERPFRILEDLTREQLYALLERRADEPRIRFSTACALAELLRGTPRAQCVSLSGIVAQAGCGNELSIVVEIDEDLALLFCDEVRYHVWKGSFAGESWFTSKDIVFPETPEGRNRAIRLYWAREMLGREMFDHLAGIALALLQSLDIVLFPTNWRTQAHFLSSILPHHQPRFVEELARDAVAWPWERIAPVVPEDLAPLTHSDLPCADGIILVQASRSEKCATLHTDGVCHIIHGDTAHETARIVWSETASEFPPTCISLKSWGLSKDGAEDDSRAFPFSIANLEFLRDLVRRGIYDEYLRLINKKRVAKQEHASGKGGTEMVTQAHATSTIPVAQRSHRSTRTLLGHFQDPRNRIARRMIARRRTAAEEEANKIAPATDEDCDALRAQ